ncbi:MAG: methyltransferase domain-containing protein [Verrucomicrobia bacterium]|nr:methyltransferase domain-containing protein [Verrucomicrobiota bacterium]
METRSYEFDNFGDGSSELERLGKQANRTEVFELSILQEAGLREGMSAIDVGCGPGLVSLTMAKVVGPKGKVIGIDTSQDLLKAAEKSQESAGLENVSFHEADAYDIDLPEETFDFAYSRLVFQHLAEPQVALDQILNVLKPGGLMCLVDIDDQWLSVEPEPEAFRKMVDRSVQIQAEQGGDRYIGHKLGAFLERAGFDAVDMRILPMTSRMMGMRSFLDIGMGFRTHTEGDKAAQNKAENELEELYTLVEDTRAWGFMAIFVATGQKRKLKR